MGTPRPFGQLGLPLSRREATLYSPPPKSRSTQSGSGPSPVFPEPVFVAATVIVIVELFSNTPPGEPTRTQ